MAKTRHLPATVFLLREMGNSPNGEVKTLTRDGKHCSSVYVNLWRESNPSEFRGNWSIASFQLDRRLARLLARRILECLEASSG